MERNYSRESVDLPGTKKNLAKLSLDLTAISSSKKSEWEEYGACGQYSYVADLWFPEGRWSNDNETAKGICDTCPVQPQCLDYAIDNPQFGIWGGLTESERERIGAASPRRYRHL